MEKLDLWIISFLICCLCSSVQSEFNTHNIKPMDYTLTITKLYLNDSKVDVLYDGEVEIIFKIIGSATKNIVLHSSELTVRDVSLKSVDKIETTFTSSGDILNITTVPETELLPDMEYTIHVEFSGVIHGNKNSGFFKKSFQQTTSNEDWIVATNFYPQSARTAFPCFDEFNLKARFNIIVNNHNDSLQVYSNMPKQESDHDDDLIYFETTEPISPQSVSLIFIHSKEMTNIINETIFQIVTQLDADSVEQIFNTSQKFLELWGEMFELSAKLAKIDLFLVPGLSIPGVSNLGSILINEGTALFDETCSLKHRELASLTIAHQILNQYFGNIVTSATLSDDWLNRGFIQFFKYDINHQIDEQMRYRELFAINVLQNNLHDYSFPIAETLLNFDIDAPDAFDAKSASLFRMIREAVTPPVFNRGVQIYLNDYKYDTATPDDFYDSLQKAINESVSQNGVLDQSEVLINLKDVFETWTSIDGYPILNVVRNGGKLLVDQASIFDGHSMAEKSDNWWVPIQLYSRTGFSEYIWLNSSQENLEIDIENALPDDWILFNLDSAYYRVNYDSATWLHLAEVLNSDNMLAIDATNRAQLIDNALHLAKAGVIDYNTTFDIFKYLVNETDYVPWLSATSKNNIVFLDNLLRTDEITYHYFKTTILILTRKIYETYGISEQPTDADDVMRLRNIAIKWQCYMGAEDCISSVSTIMNALRTEDQTVAPNLRESIYCAGMINDYTFKYLFQQQLFKSIIGDDERRDILLALGCRTDDYRLAEYLDEALSVVGYKPHDWELIISSILGNHKQNGVHIILEFLDNEDHFNTLYERYGHQEMSKVFYEISEKINNLDDLKMFNDIILRIVDEDAAENILKKAHFNIDWMAKYLDDVGKIFQAYVLATNATVETDDEEDEDGGANLNLASIYLITIGFLCNLVH